MESHILCINLGDLNALLRVNLLFLLISTETKANGLFSSARLIRTMCLSSRAVAGSGPTLDGKSAHTLLGMFREPI